MLRQRILIFEYLFGIYFALQTLFPAQFSLVSTLTGFILLSANKYYFEGLRIPYLFIIIAQALILAFSSTVVRLFAMFLVYAIIAYFPTYKYPKPSGRFHVGYKKLVLPGGPDVAVFYPTQERTKDVKYSPSHNTWERFADFIRLFAIHKGKTVFPKFVFKHSFSYLDHHKLGVNNEANIVKSNKAYPVVIFSHGLSANIHMYSVQMKEWASNGFVVFSVDHDEQIFIEGKGPYSEYLAYRNKQMNPRKETIKKVLDYIHDQKNIVQLFGSDEIKLNLDKVFGSGHSFGGGTISEVAVEDSRISGGLVLLDPWFESNNEDIAYKPINKPVLSLRSHQFDKIKGCKELVMKHVSANDNNGMVVSGFLKHSDHNSCADLGLIHPRELLLLSSKRATQKYAQQMRSHSALINAFLDLAEQYNHEEQAKDVTLKSQVVDKFRLNLKRHKLQDTLHVDE